MGHNIHAQEFITDAEMATTVMAEDGELKILYLTATWCVPCRYMKPVMKRIDEDKSLNTTVYKMDIDHNVTDDILQVSRIPTYIFVKNGIQVGRARSVKKEAEMKQLVRRHDAREPTGEQLVYKPVPSKIAMVKGGHPKLTLKNIEKIWYNPEKLVQVAASYSEHSADAQDHKSALSMVERALEQEPTALAHYVKGLLHLKLEDRTAARDDALKAQKLLSEGNSKGAEAIAELLRQLER